MIDELGAYSAIELRCRNNIRANLDDEKL